VPWVGAHQVYVPRLHSDNSGRKDDTPGPRDRQSEYFTRVS
jgi:hypothetical protein